MVLQPLNSNCPAGWPDISVIEKIVRPIIVYAFLVLILRIGGRRQMARMNASDLVVLLTLSNTVQNAIIGNDNSVTGGLIGATLLVLPNIVVVRFLYGHEPLDRRIEGEPVWLVRDGQVLEENLRWRLITQDELLLAVHRQGVGSIDECESVILKTGGTITVLPKRPTPEESTHTDIEDRLGRIEDLLVKLSARPTSSPRHLDRAISTQESAGSDRIVWQKRQPTPTFLKGKMKAQAGTVKESIVAALPDSLEKGGTHAALALQTAYRIRAGICTSDRLDAASNRPWGG